jgi:hypothetical protein
MHVAFNTVSRFLNGLFTKVQPNTQMPFELVMGVTGIATASVLVLATKGRLAYQSNTPLVGPAAIAERPFQRRDRCLPGLEQQRQRF